MLEEQIEELNDESFDLDAWKGATASIMQRIFGSGDEKVRLIKNIRVEFGSWSLRDARGNSDPVASAKKQGRSILQSAIRELRVFAADEPDSGETSSFPQGWESLLNADQRQVLRDAMQKEGAAKKEALCQVFSDYDTDLLAQLLAEVL